VLAGWSVSSFYHISVTVQNRTHVHMDFFLHRITHTIISQSIADSSLITLYWASHLPAITRTRATIWLPKSFAIAQLPITHSVTLIRIPLEVRKKQAQIVQWCVGIHPHRDRIWLYQRITNWVSHVSSTKFIARASFFCRGNVAGLTLFELSDTDIWVTNTSNYYLAYVFTVLWGNSFLCP